MQVKFTTNNDFYYFLHYPQVNNQVPKYNNKTLQNKIKTTMQY